MVYKNVGNEYGDNEIYKILEGYSSRRKFHLYLFLNNPKFTVEELLEIVHLSKVSEYHLKYLLLF